MKKSIFLSVITGLAILVCLLVFTNNSKRDKSVTPSHPKEFRVLVKFSTNILPTNLFEIDASDIENDDLRELLFEFRIPYVRAVFKNRYDSNGNLKENLATSNTHLLEGWRMIPIANFDSASLFIASVNGLKGVE